MSQFNLVPVIDFEKIERSIPLEDVMQPMICSFNPSVKPWLGGGIENKQKEIKVETVSETAFKEKIEALSEEQGITRWKCFPVYFVDYDYAKDKIDPIIEHRQKSKPLDILKRKYQLMFGERYDQITSSRNSTACMQAAEDGEIEMMEHLAKKPNFSDTVNQSIRGRSALLAAVESGNRVMVQWLLEHGANPTWSNDFGTYVDYALNNGYFKIADMLLKQGATVNIKQTSQLIQCLYNVCLHGHFSVVEQIFHLFPELYINAIQMVIIFWII